MSKYIAAEKRLAELLGWRSLEAAKVPCEWQVWKGLPPGCELMRVEAPQWARSNEAAFALMVEHGIWAKEWADKSGVEIEAKYLLHGRFPTVYTRLEDHPNKETAFRFAIVQAVIKKLEAQQ